LTESAGERGHTPSLHLLRAVAQNGSLSKVFVDPLSLVPFLPRFGFIYFNITLMMIMSRIFCMRAALLTPPPLLRE
jgi:hypothetical protein